jgi:hypothetical protein
MKPGGKIALGFSRYSGQPVTGLMDTLSASGFVESRVVETSEGFCALATKPHFPTSGNTRVSDNIGDTEMYRKTTHPATQRNIDTILAWLDAHNRQDLKAIDFYTEDIEIIEMPTGVVYKGMDKMRELAAWPTVERDSKN